MPQLFKKHELNINAISNGNYLIFKDPGHRSFIPLPDFSQLKPYKIKPLLDFNLETLTFSPKMSESNAIDFAHHSKVLSFFSDEEYLRLTTRGRFFSDSFKITLNQVGTINIQGVQIEVDAGYEGKEQFLIIEAKSSTRSTFNIRQLYYPYRHFQNRTKKKIRPILLSFSNGVYYFTELQLHPEYYDYSILQSVAIEIDVSESEKSFSLDEVVAQETRIPMGIPVPQADDLNKVIDLLALLQRKISSKFEIADYFEFDERQGDYYGNAASYIGFAEKHKSFFRLTPEGKRVLNIANRKDRNIQVMKAILQTSLFNDLLKLYLKQDNKIEDAQIVDRITQEGLTGTTPARRSGTIKAWLSWIVNNAKEYS